ncbi:MAG: hypothetical protein KAG64_04565 [Bacteroidales bacterium]|nr:hypothetical protein [Bacteroidales bacterium]
MNKKINYHFRLVLTIAGVITTYLLSYNYSFSDSIILKNEHINNQHKIQELKNAPIIILNLTKEIAQLDDIINIEDTTSQDSRKRIIDYTESSCKELDLSLIELTEPLIHTQENYIITYNRLVIEGDYFQLVKFIYELETVTTNMIIISIRMYSKKEKISKKTKIYSEIVFQTIKDKEGEYENV